MWKLLNVIIVVIFALSSALQTEKPCKLKEFADGVVCVCTKNYCDTLNIPNVADENAEFLLTTTSKSGQRFDISSGKVFPFGQSDRKLLNETEIHVHIDRNEKFQEIIGFGGAFTGSVAYLFDKLPQKLRQCVYDSYYGSETGMNYSLIRLPIGGCDFDLEPWAYNEYPENDPNLTNFTAKHSNDDRRIDLLKEMMNFSQNSNIKIIAAAWSPPRWMKMNHSWDGQPDNQLKVEYYQTWADYHVRFLDMMSAHDIPIWAISTGNEPHFSPQLGFMTMHWTASNQAKWIAENLGPTVQKSKHSHIQIHAYDDNRDFLLTWLHNMTTSSSNALDFVSGINVHGYFDKSSAASDLDAVVAQYAGKSILYTEMCFGAHAPVSDVGVELGHWGYTDTLVATILPNLLHNMNGYIDWNLLLNHTGGPNYANNFLDAAIIANADFTEIYKQPMFYIMAQFSKFISPGSRRIATTTTTSSNGMENDTTVDVVSFLRPDGKIAVILYNKWPVTINVNVIDKLKGNMHIELMPESLNTLIYST